MKLRILSTALLLILTSWCLAQPHAYTLDETLQLARRQNLQVQKSQLDIEASRELKKSLFTRYFPQASLNATYFETQNGFGISEILSDIMHTLAESDEQESAVFLKRGVFAGVGIMQPVYTGGMIHNANKLAELGTKVSRAKADIKNTEVEQEVEKYFWTLVQCYESKKVLGTMDSLVMRATHDANLAHKAGLITRNDVLEIDIYANQLESARLLLDNGIDLCKAYLCHLTGEVLYDSIQWTDIFAVTSPLALATDHNSALEQRSESSLLDMQVEAYKLQKRMTLATLLPKAFVGFNYGYKKFDIQHDGGFVKKYFNKSKPGWLLMATVNVPLLSWWGGTHSLRRSDAKIRIAELDRSEKRDLMSLQMDLKWKELQRAYQQINVSRSQYEKALENERQQSIAYRSGMITMTTRLQAEALLQKAYTDYVASCVKYQIAISEYQHATVQR